MTVHSGGSATQPKLVSDKIADAVTVEHGDSKWPPDSLVASVATGGGTERLEVRIPTQGAHGIGLGGVYLFLDVVHSPEPVCDVSTPVTLLCCSFLF